MKRNVIAEVTEEMQEIAHAAMRLAAREGSLGELITVAQAQALEEALAHSLAIALARHGLKIMASAS